MHLKNTVEIVNTRWDNYYLYNMCNPSGNGIKNQSNIFNLGRNVHPNMPSTVREIHLLPLGVKREIHVRQWSLLPGASFLRPCRGNVLNN